MRPDRGVRAREQRVLHVTPAAPGADTIVVKLGGTTLAEQAATLHAVAQRSMAQRLVLVHGGGKRLTEWLSRMGVQSRFEGGLRVTDDAALKVALGVLRGVINAELVAQLRGQRRRRGRLVRGGRRDTPGRPSPRAGSGRERHHGAHRGAGAAPRGGYLAGGRTGRARPRGGHLQCQRRRRRGRPRRRAPGTPVR